MPEPPEDAPPPAPHLGSRPHYGSGHAPDEFRGIGADLLKSFPRITPEPVGSFEPAPEVSAHGEHLLAPLQTRSGGSRVSPCPVCLSHAEVPGTAGWVPLRCGSCGTEFVATDGSPPPAPSVARPREYPVSAFGVAESRLLSLMLLGDGGARHARCPVCHALEVVTGSGGRVEVRCGSCGTDYTATDRIPPRAPAPKPAEELPAPAPYRHPVPPRPAPPTDTTEEVRTSPDGSMFVLCPQCRRFNVAVPHTSSASLTLKCPGCWKLFLVYLHSRRAGKLPPKEPPPLSTFPPLPILPRDPTSADWSWTFATWAFSLGCLLPLMVCVLSVVLTPIVNMIALFFRR